jgi:Raf kinase inhibitor-like YbhB/YbcL family protein
MIKLAGLKERCMLKKDFRILLGLGMILGLALTACSPGDTSTPVQFSYTPVPIRTNIPTGAPAAQIDNSLTTPGSSSGSTIPTAGLKLISPAFANNTAIPQKFTCSGDSISPELQFSNIPTGTQSLALTVEDPDAPRGTFVHWVIYNMPPSLVGLSEDVPKHADVSGVGTQGLNGAGLAGYTGPCPPAGKAHHYIFTLYALDLKPNLAEGLKADGLKSAIQGHILAQTQWVGLYQK